MPDNMRFAVIGREIADGKMRGRDVSKLVEELAVQRGLEYGQGDKSTQIAAIARQIGDAKRAGRDTNELIGWLCTVRRMEVHGG